MAFYNDNDAHCVQWLRNLVDAGHIAPGRVDARSVRDLQPSDLDGHQHCHFFAGIGGWAYALQLAGWPADRPVWTGSCPCQPFSTAGRRKGHADERHLWPAWARLIRECRPSVVFGEQVASADGLAWLDVVCTELEDIGYSIGAIDFPAAGIGAPHGRQRLWFVADAAVSGRGQLGRRGRACPWDPPSYVDQHHHGHQAMGDASGARLPAREPDALPGTWRRDEGRAALQSGSARWAPWADVEWLACRDGKARPTQPGLFPLAYGLSGCLGRMRAIEAAAWQEVTSYGNASNTDPYEVLRAVRAHLRATEGGQGATTRMRRELHAAEVLFAFLLSLESTYAGSEDRSGEPQARTEIDGPGPVRVLRLDAELGASRERQSDGQLAGQQAEALHALSLVLARHAEAHRRATIDANAATSRVGRLRAYGNAIVPQAAAAVIRAYMDINA